MARHSCKARPVFPCITAFHSTQIGVRRPFQLGFGFPGERHLRLARAVGLLRDGAASLLCTGTRRADAPAAWAWRWTPLDPDDANFDATVNHAWNTSKRDRPRWRSDSAMQHTCAGVSWSDLTAPLFMLSRPWSRIAAGIAVLDLNTAQSSPLAGLGRDPDLMALAAVPAAPRAARHGCTVSKCGLLRRFRNDLLLPIGLTKPKRSAWVL